MITNPDVTRSMEILYYHIDRGMIRGHLLIDGSYICDCCVPNDKALPTGIYHYELYNSPKRKCYVPQLQTYYDGRDVLDITDRHFQIHVGNTRDDTDGCILVGVPYYVSNLVLTRSSAAFRRIMSKISAGKRYVLAIRTLNFFRSNAETKYVTF